MKRIWFVLLALALLLCGMACLAEDEEDSELSLRELLERVANTDNIPVFEYGDYDADGMHEAFALVSDSLSGNEDGYSGEIWFVSPMECKCIRDTDSYLTLKRIGVGPSLFAAEVWYGGSGSSSVVWGVVQSSYASVLSEAFEGIGSGDVPNEFYMYPSAFDMSPDGTGHTWKRYYFFLDSLELKEYGGIVISRNDLEEVEGAEEILKAAEAQGWTVDDIIYRANGIINVNISDSWSNDNLTLRFDGYSVTDTGERYGGIYHTESGLVTDVVYPTSFEHEASANSAAGRAVIAAGVERETIKSGTREDILRARGVFDTNELINVTGTDIEDGADTRRIRIFFEDDVYVGGSEGYWEDWLTANGVISETYADMDGDGVEEYVILYLVSEKVSDPEYDSPYWENNWNIAVYRTDPERYELIVDFPVYFASEEERFISLLPGEHGTKIACTSLGRWDGGGGGIYVVVYGYDEQNAYVDMLSYATIGEDSYIAHGPFDIGDYSGIVDALRNAGYDDAGLRAYGLEKGKNCEFFLHDYETQGSIFYDDDHSTRLNYNAFIGFDMMAREAEKHGVILGYDIRNEYNEGYTSENYVLRASGFSRNLIWAEEGWDPSTGQSCIDFVVDYIPQSIADSALPGDAPNVGPQMGVRLLNAGGEEAPQGQAEDGDAGIMGVRLLNAGGEEAPQGQAEDGDAGIMGVRLLNAGEEDAPQGQVENNDAASVTDAVILNDSRPGFAINGAVDWYSAYEKCVLGEANASLKSLYGAWEGLDEPEYGLHDMNGDGIPELIAYNGECMARWENYVYTYEAGRVVFLGIAGYRWLYYFDSAEYPGLFSDDGAQGYFMQDYYYIQEGAVCLEQVKETIDSETYSETIMTGDMALVELAGNEDLIMWLETKTAETISQMGWNAYVEGQLSAGRS